MNGARSPAVDETDAVILGSSVAGNPGAFVELVWRHNAAVHAYLARRAGRQVADDLVAEVWLRAFAARATYDHQRADARPWLYGIARHALSAHWRETGRVIPIIPAAVSDPWPEIDERLDAGARRAELESALRTLSGGERETLLLVAWERLSSAEIALVLEVPASTVRNRLARARNQLRGQLHSFDLFDREA
jgi:RNA polymerase sigma factor (sigma-70 family)